MNDKDAQKVPAPLGPVERGVRPACWEFAMDFLGDPEAPIVDAYVGSLEAEVAQLRAVQLVGASFEAADMATAAADGYRASAAEVAKLKGQRMVLCSLLGECLPVIDALMQMPGDDHSDARLNGLAGRITGALNAVAEEQVKGGES